MKDRDGLLENVSKEKRIVLGADLNGHVGEENIGDEEMMGRYGAGTRKKEGSMIVDLVKRMNLAIVNIYFKKKDEHRVAYKSGKKCIQVDCVLCRRRNLKEMCDCKVTMIGNVRLKDLAKMIIHLQIIIVKGQGYVF